MAMLQQILLEFRQVVAAYPALVIVCIVLLIFAAFLWIWFKVPAQQVSTEESGLSRVLKHFKARIYALIEVFREIVRQGFNRSQEVYDIPWYLVLNLVADKPLLRTISPSSIRRMAPRFMNAVLRQTKQNRWYFLKSLTVYDLIDTESGKRLESDIRTICERRPQRPLDGIILSVPGRSLIDADTEQLAALIDKALVDLTIIDSNVPFELPIYFIVSECESIRGFDAFLAQNWTQRDQIFGWSSDLDVNDPYRSRSVSDAFASVIRDLNRNQVLISSSVLKLAKGDDFVLLDQELKRLQTKLSTLCDALFKATTYNNRFLFRGLYFTGHNNNQTRASDDVFVVELFEKKIVAESNLATPTNQGLLSHQRMLARYKRASTVSLVVLFILGAWSLWSVKSQFDTAGSALNQVRPSASINSTGYNDVYRVLNQLSTVDARSFSRAALPISWFSGADDELINSIADNQFAKQVFPALECRLSQNFKSLMGYQPQLNEDDINQRFQQWPFVSVWLEKLHTFHRSRHDFISLSEPARYQNPNILTEFSELIKALYGINPPQGFFRRSTLYEAALNQLNYNYERPNPRCPDLPGSVDGDSSDLFWRRVGQTSNTIYTRIQADAVSPVNVVSSVGASGSTLLKTSIGMLEGNDYVLMDRWFDFLEQNWIAPQENLNPCQRMFESLSNINAVWLNHSTSSSRNANSTIGLFESRHCEENFVIQLLKNQSNNGSALFVQTELGEIDFSDQVKAFRNSLGSVQGLAFMSVNTNNAPVTPKQVSYWDTNHLANAIGYYKEYEAYATSNFGAIALSEQTPESRATYLLQQDMLIQLRSALKQEISLATRMSISEVTRKQSGKATPEQQLIAQVQNFNEATQQFYQLGNIFNQLGVQTDAKLWSKLSRQSALMILRSADELVASSGLYQPKNTFDATQPTALARLYGLTDKSSMDDYLLAQRQRAQFIALNYTQGPVTYLLNTDSGQGGDQSGLEKRWKSTLVVLSNSALKNPSNALAVLEKRFAETLTMTVDQCPPAYTVDAGDDIFTAFQTSFLTAVMGFCSDSRQDITQKNYAWVVEQFNATLSGKYPFVGTMPSIKQDASLAAVKQFFTQFNTVRAELLADLTLKAKTDARYSEAQTFIAQLSKVSDFFADNLVTSSGDDNPIASLTVEPKFKVLLTPSVGEAQVISQYLVSNGLGIGIPGSATQLVWNYGADAEFVARLAASSAYQLAPSNTAATSVSEGVIRFTETGAWSLFRLIQRYKTALETQATKPDSGSLLLQFGVSATRPSTTPGSTPDTVSTTIDLVVGLDIYSLNSTTKQLEKREFPPVFPARAPNL
ncbi:hypothetical protein GCM10008090_33760 [Arenicella chitinivorans]|uniref:Type VI secretion system component TssM1 N-terminal domain-containing protein n=2 Tax=Arenicella chitinivorans TaxID=1329800 RepID=A0A918S3I4_9GAMM|nr:hypothetical protein GCM10008090_33760 [Arenicella chitinivorans]